MKPVVTLLSALALGFCLGALLERDSPAGNDAKANSSEPEAITLTEPPSTGQPVSILNDTLPGSFYSRSELLTMLEEANQKGDYGMMYAVLSEWVRHETADGILAVFQTGRRKEGWQLLRAWAKVDPENATALLLSLETPDRPEQEAFDTVYATCLVELVGRNPEKAVSLANGTQLRSRGTIGSLDVDLDALSDVPPEEALEALSRFRDRSTQNECATPLLKSLSKSDPEAALNWVNTHLSLSQQRRQQMTVFSEWTKNDFQSAAAYLSSELKSPPFDSRMLGTFIYSATINDPDSLVAWLHTEAVEELRRAAPIPWNNSTSPESMIDGSTIDALVEAAGPGFEWLAPQQIAHDGWDFQEIAKVPKRWPPESPEEAKLWAKFWTTSGSVRIPEIAPVHWTVSTANDAVALLKKDGETLTMENTRNIATCWAGQDPKTAMQWAAQLDPAHQIEAGEAAMVSWFANDSKSALSYLESLPESEFRYYITERIAKDWLKGNPNQAVEWIKGLPAGFEKDLARKQATLAFRYENPNRSLLQANAIANPVLRDESLENLFRVWFKRDAEAALAKLAEADLPPARREQFRQFGNH